MSTIKEVDWTLHNVGVMDDYSLNSIVKQIEIGSSHRALVERSGILVKVYAPNKREVISAALISGDEPGSAVWHVRAVEGLIIVDRPGAKDAIVTDVKGI